MTNLSKTLWLAVISAICGLGLFLASPRGEKSANSGIISARSELSVSFLEARLHAAYPDFRGIRSIQIGLARMTSRPSVELRITDSARNNYMCVAARTPGGWTIEHIRRVKVAPAGRLI